MLGFVSRSRYASTGTDYVTTLSNSMWEAAQQGRHDLVQALLSSTVPNHARFALINRLAEIQTEALRIAVRNAHVDTVTLLMSAKTDPTCGHLLQAAACAGDTEHHGHSGAATVERRRLSVLELLLEAGARGIAGAGASAGAGAGASAGANMALAAAAERGYPGAVNILVRARADVNYCSSEERTPTALAARHGHAAVVKILTEAKALLDTTTCKGYTPTCLAAAQGHVGALRVLARAKANVDKGEWTPAHAAAANGHAAVIHTLAECKANLTKATTRRGNVSYMPIHLAASEGHVDALQALVQSKVDIGAVTGGGFTAAHCAAQHDRADALYAIARMKADVDSTLPDGRTVAMVAAHHSCDALHVLSTIKADMNKAAHDGSTPLSVAIRDGRQDCVTELLYAKADVDATDNDGATPVFIAVRHNRVGALVRLQMARADITRPVHGWTPLAAAAAYGQLGAVQLLLACASELIHVATTTDRQFVPRRGNDYHSREAHTVPAGTTVLQLATRYASTDVLRLLHFAQCLDVLYRKAGAD